MAPEAPPRRRQPGRRADAGLSGPAAIRFVTRAEALGLRAVRLRALASDPDAFGSTVAREQARDAAWWEAWARRSEEGGEERTFVVEGGDPFAGLALVRRSADDPSIAFLYAMWVAPEARGTGAARGLCDACAAWAAERGCSELRLAVFASNPAARRAYAAAGFAEHDRAQVTTPDGRAMDELRMRRAL